VDRLYNSCTILPVAYLFMSMGWGYVSELRPLTGLLFIPRWYTSKRSHDGMILTGETEELGVKTVQVQLCPPQIPHGLTRAWTRASAVTGRRLTAWAMARPYLYLTTLSVAQTVAYVHCLSFIIGTILVTPTPAYKRMINWKGFGRKRSWPNLVYLPSIHLEQLRKTTKYLNHKLAFEPILELRTYE
jgi:hypothetical protein